MRTNDYKKQVIRHTQPRFSFTAMERRGGKNGTLTERPSQTAITKSRKVVSLRWRKGGGGVGVALLLWK